ncbi:hypothetical protein D3C86_1788960 [compost metagenome]
MLHLGLIEQVGLFDGLAQGWVENLLLDLRVDLEFHTDFVGQLSLLLLCRGCARFGQFAIRFEHLLHMAVVGVEKAAGIGIIASGRGHRGAPWVEGMMKGTEIAR